MFEAERIISLVERTKSQDLDESFNSRLTAIAAEASELSGIVSLSAHPAIVSLRERLLAKVSADEADLLSKRDMEKDERNVVLDRVSLYRTVSALFDREASEQRLQDLSREAERLSAHASGIDYDKTAQEG